MKNNFKQDNMYTFCRDILKAERVTQAVVASLVFLIGHLIQWGAIAIGIVFSKEISQFLISLI